MNRDKRFRLRRKFWMDTNKMKSRNIVMMNFWQWQWQWNIKFIHFKSHATNDKNDRSIRKSHSESWENPEKSKRRRNCRECTILFWQFYGVSIVIGYAFSVKRIKNIENAVNTSLHFFSWINENGKDLSFCFVAIFTRIYFGCMCTDPEPWIHCKRELTIQRACIE